MSEVGLTDLSRLLHSKRNESTAIVTSRKRKLRELFAVAAQNEGLPHDGFTKPDAPPPTQAEWEFLQENEILQGKKLNEQTIPLRHRFTLDALHRSFALLGYGAPVTVSKSPATPAQPILEAKRPQIVKPPTPASLGSAPTSTPPIAPQQTKPTTEKKQSPPIPLPNPAIPSNPSTPTSRPATTVPKGPTFTPVPIPIPATKSVSRPTPVPAPTPVPVPVPGQATANTLASTPSTAPAKTPVAVPSPVQNAPTGPNVVATKPQPQVATPAQNRPPQPTIPPRATEVPLPPTKATPVPVPGTATEEKRLAVQPRPVQPSSGPPPTSLKIPSEPTRAPDTVSTPGSTAASVATPVAHDASADTSPENETLSLPEAAQPAVDEGAKDELRAPKTSEEEKKSPATQVAETEVADSDEPSGSAEDQLLQESIQSSTAVAISKKAPDAPTADGAQGTAPVSAEEAKSQLSQNQPETTKSETPQREKVSDVPPTEAAKSAEIPDSRDPSIDLMEIDSAEPKENTTTEQPAEVKNVVTTTEKAAEAPTTPITPVTPAPVQKNIPQPAERAVTRVSSGAMRPRTVNEIVGQPPKLVTSTSKSTVSEEPQDRLTPLASTPQSSVSRTRRPSSGRKDKKVSAVLFGKQPKRVEEKDIVTASREAIHPSDDYFTPLFVQGFAGSSTWMQPMEKKLFHANKTVATPDATLCIQDHQACRVLRRVYHLQSTDKWSLRQPRRCEEPVRPPSHWDLVLQEAKWMRTDFREERKWKMAVARNLANACADWHEASPEERKAMQVPAVIPPKVTAEEDETMADGAGEVVDSQATPDLIPGDADSPQVLDELTELFPETISPSAIFTLQEDDVVFGLRRTPVADQLLDELPLYGAPLKVPRADPAAPDADPDAHWRRSALPLSKYVEGQMKLTSEGPPRKRSRYHYRNEDSDDDDEGGFVAQDTSPRINLAPTSSDVALFNPDMKHIRDRLHAGHQFRPPTDHPMPSQTFYESRSPSMWTLSEDDELRSLVREYSYNWPLIASMLASKSLFMSGAERRTPWECFERWIQLEGLPSDMQKTQYFKAYNTRIEAAQRVIMQQNQLAAQQASAAGAAVPPLRKRPSTPMRVERRRNQKHLTILDAMRKLAKKRETTIQKQQHAASQNAANKKPQDAVAQAQRGPNKTPRDYSLMRWERDQALAEKMAAFAHRQDATRRAAMMQQQARAQGQAGQRPATPGMQAAQAVQAGAAHPAAPNGANAAATRPNGVNGQAIAMATPNMARPRMSMPPPGTPATVQLAATLAATAQVNGNVAQGQVQGMAAQQTRVPMPNHQQQQQGQQQQPDANMMIRAQRISEQQRAAVQQLQQAQQVQHPQHQSASGTPRPASQHNSPPMGNGVVNGVNGVNGVAGHTAVNGVNGVHNGVNGVNGTAGITQQSFLNAQAMMAQFNNANAAHSPPTNMQMAAGSPGPRPLSQTFQMPPAIVNQINQFESQIRAKNPNLTMEQARQLATEHLARVMAARNSAMSAAAGGSAQHGIANSIAATTSPHQYAALLRQQQQQQAQQQAAQQQAHQAQAQQQQQAQAQQNKQHAAAAAAAVSAAQTPAASSPGQASQTSQNRQGSESATPSAPAS